MPSHTLLPAAFHALARAAWRGWCARPFIALLNVLGIAIGTGVFLAIRMVNTSATESFSAGLDLVAGKSHLEITSPTGGVDESLWPVIQKVPGVAAVTGIVEAYATRPDMPGEYLHIMGVDPFTSGPFYSHLQGTTSTAGTLGTMGQSSEAWLAQRDSLMVSSLLAQREAWPPGHTLTLHCQGRPLPVRILGHYPLAAENSATMRTAFLDIGWAQELTQTPGRLHSLQIIAADPAQLPSLITAISRVLPPDITVAPPARRSAQTGLMLQGFQLNLTALSMVSLLVGVFLTGNTIAASVVRQRREIGTLRAIGASSRQIMAVFLGEATVSAVLGSLLGLPAAALLAENLLSAVGRTISMHYVQLSLESTTWQPLDVALTLICGLGSALLGAWWPAREATQLDPVAILRPGRLVESAAASPSAASLRRRLLLAAPLLLALSTILAWAALRTGPPWLSFAACLTCVLGFVLASRLAVQLTTAAAGFIARRSGSLLIRTGADHLSRALHRAAPTVAALLTAVSMVIGVDIMIHSFRSTLQLWVGDSLRADLYIAPAANEVIKRSAVMPADTAAWLRARPEVAELETLVETSVETPTGTRCRMRIVDRSTTRPFAFKGLSGTSAYDTWFTPDHLAISEVLARRLRVTTGQTLTFLTPAGPRPFTICGEFHDYSDDQGCLYISTANWARHWPAQPLHAIAVYTQPGTDATALGETLRTAQSRTGELAIYANAALRERVFTIFDQTFAITALLRIIALAVAVLGIAMALGTIIAERAWEIAVLRSIGAGRRQIAAIHLAEAALLGVASALPGMACGLCLSMILTWVVNQAFFGWTVHFSMPWASFLSTPLWVTAAAIIAGLIPALLASRAHPATALRME